MPRIRSLLPLALSLLLPLSAAAATAAATATKPNIVFILTDDQGYEGGHRGPLLAHWPAAGWTKPHVNDTLCHAVDIVPTLLDLTGAPTPAGLKFDGLSIRPLLDPAAKNFTWPHERILVTDSQRVRDPVNWKQTAVMSGPCRLINGRELYDIQADPGQQRNLIAEQPARAAKMRAFYDAWWTELEPTFAQTTEIYLGHPAHPVVSLTGHDWIQEELPPWNQQHIRRQRSTSSNTSTAPPPAAAHRRFPCKASGPPPPACSRRGAATTTTTSTPSSPTGPISPPAVSIRA